MKLLPLFALIFPLHAQAIAADSGTVELGQKALASGLWEIAAGHFEQAIKAPELADAEKSEVALLLAESLIRGGRAKDAENLLRQPEFAEIPGASYWLGEALAGLGDFEKAAPLLASVAADPDAPHRREAASSAANLFLSLNQPDRALEILQPFTTREEPLTAAQARLHSAEILLDQKQHQKAREILPTGESLPPQLRESLQFIEANLLLAEGEAEAAASKFAALLARPEGQTLSRHQAASLGLADAQAARNDLATATLTLLDFIQQYPDSGLLQQAFERLLVWLPKKPAITDPIIVRLASWLPPTPPRAPAILNVAQAGAAGVFPVVEDPADFASSGTELPAFALYTSAVALHRVGSPEADRLSRVYFSRLQFTFPQHFLAARSLIQSGRWLIADGKFDEAIAVLEAAAETTQSPTVQGESAFLRARACYQTQDYAKAAELFEQAADFLPEDEKFSALANADRARILAGLPTVLTSISVEDASPKEQAMREDIELEKALATTPVKDRIGALNAFLEAHPDHPRATEARLAGIAAALETSPPDQEFANRQLDWLRAHPEEVEPAKLMLAELQISNLTGESAATIQLAHEFIEAHPADPAVPEVSFILGRNLFDNGNFNDARIVFTKLAGTEGLTPAQVQVAWLLAARSASLGATPQSREESLALFDQAISIDASVTAIAKMEKANLMIELNHITEAIALLREWFNATPDSDPLRIPAGLLLGEAIYSEGAGNPDSYQEALAVYDQLLENTKSEPALFNRLQYLRGMTLEQLPRSEDPSQKRDDEALVAYYSVLEAAGDQAPAEWHFFELAGMRALGMLEKNERWSAAISVAEKIASFNGPGAKEAAARARQIRLKHFIWED